MTEREELEVVAALARTVDRVVQAESSMRSLLMCIKLLEQRITELERKGMH